MFLVILLKLSGYVDNGIRSGWLYFGGDPDHCLDPLVLGGGGFLKSY